MSDYYLCEEVLIQHFWVIHLRTQICHCICIQWCYTAKKNPTKPGFKCAKKILLLCGFVSPTFHTSLHPLEGTGGFVLDCHHVSSSSGPQTSSLICWPDAAEFVSPPSDSLWTCERQKKTSTNPESLSRLTRFYFQDTFQKVAGRFSRIHR